MTAFHFCARAAVLVVGFLSVASCTRSLPVETPVSTSLEPSAPSRWVLPRSVDGAHSLQAPARVLASPQATAAVSVPLQARIVRIRVAPGQRVQRGEAVVDVLMPEAVRAAGALAAANLKVDALSRRLAQLTALKADGLVRAIELVEVESQVATARADAQSARAVLRAAGLSDRAADAVLVSDGVVPLSASITGVVTKVDAKQGEARDPLGRPLLELEGEGEVRVEARLPALVEGARFSFVSASGVVSPVVLTTVSPRAETNDGSRLAWFVFEVPQTSVVAGSAGRVRIEPDSSWRAVPTRSVRTLDGGAHVLARQLERVSLVPVRVVTATGADVVVAGVPANAEVAADFEAMEQR